VGAASCGPRVVLARAGPTSAAPATTLRGAPGPQPEEGGDALDALVAAHVLGTDAPEARVRDPDLELPPLEAVVTKPVFDREGNLVSTPGYHRKARLWFHRPEGFDIGTVPERPTTEAVRAAGRDRRRLARPTKGHDREDVREEALAGPRRGLLEEVDRRALAGHVLHAKYNSKPVADPYAERSNLQPKCRPSLIEFRDVQNVRGRGGHRSGFRFNPDQPVLRRLPVAVPPSADPQAPDPNLFIRLAEEHYRSVWWHAGSANEEILKRFVAGMKARSDAKRLKVAAYRHPDPYYNPVFCQFGVSRPAIEIRRIKPVRGIGRRRGRLIRQLVILHFTVLSSASVATSSFSFRNRASSAPPE
jgi:hypothetical protein